MHLSLRSKVSLLFSLLALLAIGGAFALTMTLQQSAHAAAANPAVGNVFAFNMVPSNANITRCLPNARASVSIVAGPLNDTMTVSVKGLAPNTGYDLFVTEIPGPKFGISWYQTDIETDSSGAGSVSVRGVFDVETFSVSLGGSPTHSTTAFPPTHQYHLGLWFNDPQVPFKLGCEPGATQPIVTPFNGEQHAGIQVLNTSNFPENAGPLSHVHR